MAHDELVKELRVALKRPLSAGIFTKPADYDLFPILSHICRSLALEMWDRSGEPHTARKVIRAAVERLPHDDRPDENPDYAVVTWHEVGMTLCGFRKDLPLRENGRDYDYNALIAVLKSESKIEPKKWDYWGKGELVGTFYKLLADALLKLEKEGDEGRVEISDEDDVGTGVEEDETPFEPPGKGHSHSSSDRIFGLFNVVVHGSASVKTKISSKVSPRKRKRVLLMVSASAAAILIIGFVGVRFLFLDSGTDGDPLDISIAWSGNPHALILAFPDSERETGLEVVAEANSARDPRDLKDLAVEAGAYYVSQMEVHILLAGAEESEVQVTNIRPVFKNPPSVAASGLLMRAIGSGGDDMSTMQFVLDEPDPVAREWFPGEAIDPREGNPFFQSQSIGVIPGQDRTVIMRFNAYWGSYDFEVAIDYQVNGDEYTSLLSDGDDPRIFRVSGLACPQEPTELGLSEGGERNPDLQYTEVWEQAPPNWGIDRVEAEGYCEMWQEEGWRPAQ